MQIDFAPLGHRPPGTAPVEPGATNANPSAPKETLRVGVEPPSPNELADATERFNTRMTELNVALQFSIDDDSGRLVVKVLDRVTDEVIRQIPAEEMLELAKHMERIRGLLVRNSA